MWIKNESHHQFSHRKCGLSLAHLLVLDLGVLSLIYGSTCQIQWSLADDNTFRKVQEFQRHVLCYHESFQLVRNRSVIILNCLREQTPIQSYESKLSWAPTQFWVLWKTWDTNSIKTASYFYGRLSSSTDTRENAFKNH